MLSRLLVGCLRLVGADAIPALRLANVGFDRRDQIRIAVLEGGFENASPIFRGLEEVLNVKTDRFQCHGRDLAEIGG
ncbi:hypothetical protein VP03_23105 [Sinorhizobium meliloti]|nr:hypothetical protein VP03_23105 [Sinorhizobium meliloti]